MNTEPDNPKIRVPPPLIFLFFFFLGTGLNRIYPLHFLEGSFKWFLFLAFLGIAVFLASYSFFLFKKSKTEVLPWKPASALVIQGPYKYTRNPMYLSFVLMGISLSIYFSNAWILILMVPFAWVIDRYAIKKEEEYLKRRFGKVYLDYQKKVRRWI